MRVRCCNVVLNCDDVIQRLIDAQRTPTVDQTQQDKNSHAIRLMGRGGDVGRRGDMGRGGDMGQGGNVGRGGDMDWGGDMGRGVIQ